MADIFDRITTNPDNEEPSMGGHYLPSALVSYHNPNGDTTAQIKSFFNMDVDAIADWDALIAHFDGLTVNNKLAFLAYMQSATDRIELGVITTKTQYVNYLGI